MKELVHNKKKTTRESFALYIDTKGQDTEVCMILCHMGPVQIEKTKTRESFAMYIDASGRDTKSQV